MKYLLLSISLLSTICTCGQSFATLDGTAYNAKNGTVPWGIDFTGGAFLKNKDDKGNRSFTLGAGIGVIVLQNGRNEGRDFYAPLYMQVGYFNKDKQITPYINARIGYGFYKGTANFIDEDAGVKGGLYANIRGGAGFATTKKMSVVPFIGCSLIMLRKVVAREAVDQYNAGLLNAGVSLFFKGGKK